jgi:hypothetical protein
MTQGVIAEWCKKEGEVIKAGDAYAKVETDKATVDFESTDDAIMGKILVPAGEALVGRLIALGWMLGGIFLVALFTSTLTATMTMEQIQGNIHGPRDLAGRTIGCQAASVAVAAVRQRGGMPV